jgi:putative flippase GtrA
MRRFALVGVVNTLIDLLLFVALRSAGMPVLGANAISTTAGLAFSFVANRRFTFADRTGHLGRQLVLFIGGTGVGLWVLQPAIILGLDHLLRTWGATSDALLLWVPKLAAIAAGIVWNYVFYDRVAFRVTGSRVEVLDERA